MKYLSLAILFVLPACSGDESVPFDPFATDIDFGGGNPFTPPTQAPPGSGGGGGTPPPAPIPPGTTTDRSIVSKVTPPIGLTLYIGMAENVTMAAMQGVYSQFASVNTTLEKPSSRSLPSKPFGSRSCSGTRVWSLMPPKNTALPRWKPRSQDDRPLCHLPVAKVV